MSLTGSVIVGLALLGTVLVALSLWRNPVLRRLSLRNIGRRKGSTLLVIAGSMVGTALIAGALVIGDTARRLDLDLVYRHLGEIDEVVVLPGSQGRGDVYFDRRLVEERVTVERLNAETEASQGEALVDGLLPVIQEEVPVQKVDPATGKPILVEPRVMLVALDWEELARFGRRPPSLTRPSQGEVLVSQRLTRELELNPGDTLQVFASNRPHTFTVREVVEDQGISGYRDPWDNIPGTMLMNLEDGQAVFAAGADQVNAIFISNAGGVIDSLQHTPAVREALGTLLRAADPRGDFRVQDFKPDLMGENFIGELFLTISSFAIVAGIMLVLNIYTMLAEERRTEMGVMRAMGMRRGHLVRLYLYEGLLYSLGASLVGVVVGLAIASLVLWGMNEFAFATSDSQLRLVFTIKPLSLVVAGAAGMVVTLGTVLYSSLRISGINIVAAMRDLPDPSRHQRRRRWTLVWPLLLALLGLLLTSLAVSGDSGFLYVLGPTLAVLGLALVLQRYLPARAVLSVVYLGLIAFSQLAFQIPAVNEAYEDSPTMLFFTGIILVLATIGLVVVNFPVVIWLVRQSLARLRRILPVVRVAIAYPAERPTQTGFTLGMFSLVIFMATLASIFLALFSSRFEEIRQGEVGGFDAIVDVNPLNPVSDLEERLRQSKVVQFDNIVDISTIRSTRVALPQYRQVDYQNREEDSASHPDAPLHARLTGVDAVFLGATTSQLDVRAPEFASDRAVWEALARDPTLVVVDDNYRGENEWDMRPTVKPGDVLQLRDRETGLVYEKRVVGRLVGGPLWWTPISGILISQEALEGEFSSVGGVPEGPYVLHLAQGVDQKAVANSMEKELIANGAQVHLVTELLEEAMSWFNFIRIIQGFLAFGLLVGIAGLGVVAARAVYQRKQDICTLRALGFRRGMVLAYFLVESSFVALLGILLGVAAGTLAGYAMYLNDVRQDIGGSFAFPALELGGLVALVYLVALAFTFLPALRAASLAPVEALRPKE